ncbi:MAG: hypothetical protein M3Y72_03305 [Acidobacteriota bacterium]|nr:hypothetical protein [Acidobacteriota bacterium]
MTADPLLAIQRRDFLKLAGAMTAFGFGGSALAALGGRVAIVIDANDPVASSGPVKWAAGQLRQALSAKGSLSGIFSSLSQAEGSTFFVLVAGPASDFAKGFSAHCTPLEAPESIHMTPGKVAESPAILVSGSDARGSLYGLLELAERVQFGHDPAAGLYLSKAVEEKSANEVRSVARAFCSEIEDKAWYYDKNFWRGYLDVIAASRFNRFNLAFGFGYDFPRGVTGDYFHFVYPYLVDVPGYNVRVIRLTANDGQTPGPLSTQERDRNFDILRFIAAETGARGLQFQLGIWTHAYQWTDSPRADHRIEGLTPETHAAYCRDALAMILKACPEIQGLTLRVHGESGIPEGSYPFWRTLFEAISGCGRKVEIEMHSKGVNSTMIDMATETGMPVKLGAKYSAEHQSLGYNQADIRDLEIPRPARTETGLFSVSNGARRFTRYGYADFFQEGSRYKVLFRLWPGTQRHLLSADPEMAAAFGRTSNVCGAAGLELCEPLTFKGREGSGLPSGRCAYADESLNPKDDWRKFEYYYRVWGRCLYNPDAEPETWRRYLRSDFGKGANSVETAVANSSRVLPLLTSAHLASASNHSFWPELDTNMPIVLGSEPSPYSDTPTPKCFGTVSPLDPQLFSTIAEHAADLLAARSNPKYSPVEVAQWLDGYTAAAEKALATARLQTKSKTSPEFRRIEEDVLIQNGLGHFFAAKIRSGVLFEIYQQTGDSEAGKLALEQYLKARDSWTTMALRAQKIYRANITYGDVPIRQGHWIDRVSSIEKDIDAMKVALLHKPDAETGSPERGHRAIQAVIQATRRLSIPCRHTPPQSFQPGKSLSLSLSLINTKRHSLPSSVLLRYRHVNQAERWHSAEMQQADRSFKSAIPGDYTNSPFPLEYYFELRQGSSEAWFYPAFNAALSNQPYFAIFKRDG